MGPQGGAVIAGDPLLDRTSRSQCDPEYLLGEPDGSDADLRLGLANGQFCTAIIDLRRGARLRLCVDRLGIRPLYYAEHAGVVYFGTAQRMLLRACAELGEIADLTGQVQLASLGYTLGDRTPFQRIKCVRPSEVVAFDGVGCVRRRYAEWPAGADATVAETDAIPILAERFVAAAAERAGGDSALAYLSGGLDSRCVVAALARGGRRVQTINFAPPGSADLILGAEAAGALGTQHFEHHDGSADFWDRTVESVRAWRAKHSAIGPDTPVAAGFGGEGVLAPTNITAEMIEAARAGRIDRAIELYLRDFSNGVAVRLLRPHWRERLPELLVGSMHDEVRTLTTGDPAVGVRKLVLLNEPRGHLAGHYENLDLRRVEWTLPFLDARVLDIAIRLPVDSLLQHRFYYKWMHALGPAVASVPWQAYPSSLPCPLPCPVGVRDQWSQGWHENDVRRRELRQLARRVLGQMADERFPGALLDRRVLRLACWAARLGFARFEYLLQAADTFAQKAARVYPPVAPIDR
jgi:hypothetical protein